MYQKGLPGAWVAADGQEADRSGAYAAAGWTTTKPESRRDTNVLQAWDRQRPLSSGRRDSRVPDRSRGADNPGW